MTLLVGIDAGGPKPAGEGIRVASGQRPRRHQVMAGWGGTAGLADCLARAMDLADPLAARPVGLGVQELIQFEGEITTAAASDWRSPGPRGVRR